MIPDDVSSLTEEDWTKGELRALALGLKVSWQWVSDSSPRNGFYLIPGNKISWGIKFAPAGPFESMEAAIVYLLEDVTNG